MVTVRRAEVAARIQEAKEHGDITENAEYEDAKNEQAFVEVDSDAVSADQERRHHRRARLDRLRRHRLNRRRRI
jgi:transcription elongation GreA/GreB family factor